MKGELKYRERGEGKGGRIREEGTGWGRVEGSGRRGRDGEGWKGIVKMGKGGGMREERGYWLRFSD